MDFALQQGQAELSPEELSHLRMVMVQQTFASVPRLQTFDVCDMQTQGWRFTLAQPRDELGDRLEMVGGDHLVELDHGLWRTFVLK